MKRLTKIGILMVVMSMVVIYIGSLSFQASLSQGNIQSIGLMPHSSKYFSFNLTNSTVVGFVYYTNRTQIDYYLLDQAGFSEAYGNASSSNMTAANTSRLRSNGEIDAIYNSSEGVFPSQQNASSIGLYQNNDSPILPSGSYYSLFQNPSASNVTVFYSLITKSPKAIQSSIIYNAAYGVAGVGMFFGGILLVIYAVFLQKAKTPEEKGNEDVESIYASQRTSPKKSHHRKKGKTSQ